MKLTKYIFLLPSAVDVASRRHDIPSPSPHQLFVLYSVYYLPVCTHAKIVRHAKRMRHPISQPTISQSLQFLVSCGLVTMDESCYYLSPIGREFLSSVRRYLLNRRLS